VEFLRPVHIAAAPRPAGHGKIDAALLAGGAAAERLVLQEGVLHGGHELLDAHHHHIDPRQRRTHAPVALVGDDADRAGFGDGEVAAADAHVRGEKLAAQPGARYVADHLRVERGRHVQFLLE